MIRHTRLFTLLALFPSSLLAAEAPPKPASAPNLVEMRFADDSSIKMALSEEQIEIATPYGKLRVPFTEVMQIDFATRIPVEIARQIDKAATELASADEKVRDLAAAELLKHRERAYPALVAIAKSPDLDLKQRAEALLERLREVIPEDQPLFRAHDVIHTADMKIAGRIETSTWKGKTSQFGNVEIKLVDLRSLRSPWAEEKVEIVKALPDPGNLEGYKNQIGKKFAFTVTGLLGNGLYGTDVYTSDSRLNNAAVHAGVLKPGQTGVVKVEIVNSPNAFVPSTRNGVTSSGFGAYNGAFKILK